MSRSSHLLVSVFFCSLFVASFLPSVTESQGILRSLSLNGSNQYVTAPGSTSLNITGAITVEGWIKLNSIGAYRAIVSREAFQQTGTGGGYRLVVTDTGKLRLDLFQSHNTYTTAIGTTTITTGVWHHVAGVFDGSQMRVYVDGVLNGSVSTTSGPASGTGGFYIGRFSYSFNPYYFNGLIDEVRVSAAALYTSNFTPGSVAGTNVRGLWKFDGQTPNDSSGNNNHGTLQNGAAYSTDVPSIGGSQPPVPVANGPYNGQPGQVVSFNSSGSYDPDGTIASYHWDFGDGTSSNTATPSRTYTVPGVYTATLTVTDNSGLWASATASVTISSGGIVRLDPLNQTGGSGENPLSRNFNWTLPLVSLAGRAGMDLNLSLSYNSLVWTRTGNYISFDEDRGFPGPGFRVGFPVIHSLYYNAEVGKNAFLLIGSDGDRTELRQVGTSSFYEAADSSYLLLEAGTMVLRMNDGTQLKYQLKGSEYQCTEIKDRNGNYLTLNYTGFNRIDTVIDTLGRSIKFNYDANGWLTSITQIWNQGTPSQVTHNWAIFEYTNTTIQTSFPGLTVSGPLNGSAIKTVSKVTLADGSHYDFSYTSWGQVWKVSSFAADNHLLNYRSYNLPQTAISQTDCPRFTERRDWAENWNRNTSGVEQEAITTYAAPVTDTWTMPGETTSLTGLRVQITMPDLTSNKIYFVDPAGTTADWQRGLPALVNTYDSAGTLQRQVKTTWTQDNTSVPYQLNPRVIETNTYDPAGNRARVQMTYQQVAVANGSSCHLPRDLYEYAANATTILRSTRTDYHTSTAYTGRRIIGLVSERRLYEGDVNNGGVLMSKVGFFYDNENGATSIQGNDAPIQHDNTNYTASFVTGRANLSSVRRYDVTNTAQFTTTRSKYNTAGAVVSATDASTHTTQFNYADSFSDGNNSRNTLAYPTTLTVPDGYTATAKYSFDFGAVTYRRTPQANTTQNLAGPEQTITYDVLGRPQQVTNQVNGAYTRYVYPNTMTRVDTYTTIQEGLGEAFSAKYTDGAGRVIATATQHPGSVGGYSGQRFVYDVMGRRIRTSNPTETSASGAPSQWVTAGDDAAAGWVYTHQTYDWKSRPLVITNQDGTTKTASYAGCGCAGGEVVTLTDEGTLDNGLTKRRQQKIYSDVLGRTAKVEVLNWDGGGQNGTGGSVYSATVNTYNARDQVMSVRQYAGAEGSGNYQDAALTYDGHGRLKTKHLAQQQADPNVPGSTDHTTWDYNADDTIQKVTDARGASQTLSYNGRHLVTGITYTAPTGTIPTGPVGYGYDAAGNRTWMTDENGRTDYSYNQLSQLLSETRQFNGLTGSYALTYAYNLAGQLKTITDPAGASIYYGHDAVGRIISVTGSPYGGVSQYASALVYRAWGGLKGLTYGNNFTRSVSYNSRLKSTQFEVAGRPTQYGSSTVMKTQYQYYADGSLKYADDLLDHRFDRAYGYDHTARLKETYSGSEAGNFINQSSGGTPTGPYRQSYVYDVWSNPTSRVGRFWSKQTSFSASYSNGRNTNSLWQFDADGRVLREQSLKYTYDAAGRNVTTSSLLVNQYTGGSVTQSRDGDGLAVKRAESRQGVTTVGYLVRSSILGGRVVTELSASGQKLKSYVDVNGERLAEQAGGVVHWKHTNPVTGSEGSSFTMGGYSAEKELDSMLVNVGFEDPYLYFEEPQADSSQLWAGSSNGECTVEGMTWECMSAQRLRELGAAEEMVPSSVFAIYGNGTIRAVWSGLVPIGSTQGVETSYPVEPAGGTGGNSYAAADTGFAVLAGTSDSSVTVQFGVVHEAMLPGIVGSCISKLYPMFKMKKFKRTTRPTSKVNDDSFNGVVEIEEARYGSTFTVVSDPTPPQSAIQIMKATNSRGLTPKFENYKINGENPFWTYACPSCDSTTTPRPGEVRYPELYKASGEMAYFRAQIHELGAALTLIRNAYYSPVPLVDWEKLDDGGLYKGKHEDDGPAMEDCVGSKYYEMNGLKPIIKQ